MKSIFYTSVMLSFCFFANGMQAEEVELFNAAKSGSNEFAPFSAAGAESLRVQEGMIEISAKANTENPGIVVNGMWNISDYQELVVVMSNSDPKGSFPVLVRLQNPGGFYGKDTYAGVLIDKVNLKKGLSEYVVKIPPRVPHPDVEKQLKGMRYTPYRSMGLASCLNPDSVSKVIVYLQRPRSDWKWSLVRIYVRQGNKLSFAPWVHYPSQQFFPFIDTYGQFKHKDWPGKIHNQKDLQQAALNEKSDLANHPGPPDRSPYGGWLKGPRQEAKGHFYVKKIEGKWWMVDPEGYLFWSHGAVRVTSTCGITPLDGRDQYFEQLPAVSGEALSGFYKTRDELLYPYYQVRGIQRTYDFSGANLFRKYGKDWQKIFQNLIHQRFRSWGLNTLANGSERGICLMDKTPYTDRIELKSPDIEGSTNFHGWWKFKDPFHPEFVESFRQQLQSRQTELEDPWCFGLFVDNEISWGTPTSLAEWVLMSPARQPAKVAMKNYLVQRYTSIANLSVAWGRKWQSWEEFLNDCTSRNSIDASKLACFESDCKAFNLQIIEQYFRTVRTEFKRVAPDKLYLGCRFAGSNEVVLRIAAKYCDVISYNIYSKGLDQFRLPEGLDKPVMVGEFHFGALDRGLFHPGLVECSDQQDRAQAYLKYVRSALTHPNFIGTHWHQYSDQATTGRFDGENFQVGFTDVCDTPYPEIIQALRTIGDSMYRLRWEGR